MTVALRDSCTNYCQVERPQRNLRSNLPALRMKLQMAKAPSFIGKNTPKFAFDLMTTALRNT